MGIVNEKEKGIIAFKFSAASVLENVPDLDEMALSGLQEYHKELEAVLMRLDAAEPKSQNSDAYEQWAEEHEDLEDLIDEVLDRIDDLN